MKNSNVKAPRVKSRKELNLSRTALMRVDADIGAHWDTSWHDNHFLYCPSEYVKWYVSDGKKYTNIYYELRTAKEAKDYVKKGAKYFNTTYGKMKFFMVK